MKIDWSVDWIDKKCILDLFCSKMNLIRLKINGFWVEIFNIINQLCTMSKSKKFRVELTRKLHKF